MNPKLKRTPGIFLVGFMGSGKTTAGRILARRLGWRFVNVDDEIEAGEGISIPEIFAARGEAEFRGMEAAALLQVAQEIGAGKATVVASGGGAFAQPGNADVMANNGVSIWLDVPLDVAWQRVSHETHRPLARSFAEFSCLYERRREAYSRAEHRVDASQDAAAVVDEIVGLGLFD
jgi:shikimate kinase